MYEDRAPESVWGGERKGPWWRRGPATAPSLWKYSQEAGDPGAPLGTWAVDGALALARVAQVEAYGLTTGTPLWTWQPPHDEVIAHVSPDSPDGVGVVLHHADGDRPEHVHLTGLDLGTGTAVWTRTEHVEELGSMDAGTRVVALGGGRVVTVRAHSQDTPPTVSQDAPPTVRVGQDTPSSVRVLDAHTGTFQWERPIPEGWGDASVLTADPVVVSTVGRGEAARGSLAPRRLHVVSENAERAIDLPRPHTEMPYETPPLYEDFGAHPAVVGDTIAVEFVTPDVEDAEHTGSRLQAFSTATGDPVWTWQSTYGRTIFPLAHQGFLVVLNGYGDRATVLDPADGRVVAERSLPGYSFQARLAASGDCLAVICEAPRALQRLRVFRWK